MQQREKVTRQADTDFKSRIQFILFSKALTLAIFLGVISMSVFAGCEHSTTAINGLENIQDGVDKKQEKIDELTNDD